MENGWFDRLVGAIEADGRSLSALSVEAGLGRNFVQQMIKNRKEPGVDNMNKILAAFPKSTAIYVVLGMRLEEEDVQLIEAMTALPPQAKASARDFFRSLVAR